MRPPKQKQVQQLPPVNLFKPAGSRLADVAEVVLTIEEMEAIRLADVEGMDQEPGSECMNISRPTFHRMLERAHQKIGQALWEGKAIRIEGGNFRVTGCQNRLRCFECKSCGHSWEVPCGTGQRGCDMPCPGCGAKAACRRK